MEKRYPEIQTFAVEGAKVLPKAVVAAVQEKLGEFKGQPFTMQTMAVIKNMVEGWCVVEACLASQMGWLAGAPWRSSLSACGPCCSHPPFLDATFHQTLILVFTVPLQVHLPRLWPLLHLPLHRHAHRRRCGAHRGGAHRQDQRGEGFCRDCCCFIYPSLRCPLHS